MPFGDNELKGEEFRDISDAQREKPENS